MNQKSLLPAMALFAFAICLYWIASRRTADVPPVPKAEDFRNQITPELSAAELRAERDSFFKTDVAPCIAEADRLNREAAERGMDRLKNSLDGYRTGIAPFCKEINTWGTRLGVVRRMPTDWWYEKTDVVDFIQAKFAKHLFTDEKLKADIANALVQYRQEVIANQNTMISQIRASVSSHDIPGLPEIDYSEFAGDLSRQLNAYSTQAAKDSVVTGIVVEVASGVGGLAAEQLLVQIVGRLAGMSAASAATAGGATAGGAAVGGGAGLLGGPVGTAIGIAGGLVIGAIIDWWMSSNFEAKMAEQLNELIDAVTDEVIDGDADRTGLRDGLYASCDVMRQAYENSLHTRIVDGASR